MSRNIASDERGNTTIELAVILPIIISVFLLAINMTMHIFCVSKQKIVDVGKRVKKSCSEIVGFHNQSGTISVFVCIVMSALLLFMSVFYFSTTVYRQRDIISGCAMLETRSYIANYDKMLEQKYDLLGVEDKNNQISQLCAERLRGNIDTALEFNLDKKLNISVCVEKVSSLADNGEVIEQLSNGFLERTGDKSAELIKELFNNSELLNISKKIIRETCFEKFEETKLNSFLEQNPEINATFEDVKNQTTKALGNSKNKVLGVLSGRLDSFEKESKIGMLLTRGMANEQAIHIFSSVADKKKRDIRKYELEYIITGIDQDSLAAEAVKGEILAIRLGLNTAYFLSNPALMSKAATIASATAGWTVVGVGVVQAAIIGLWCLAESLIDVQIISGNKKTALFKSSSTWLTNEYNMVTSIEKLLKNEVVDLASGVVSDVANNAKNKISRAKEQIDKLAEETILKIEDFVFAPIDELLNKGDSLGREAIDEYLRLSNERINEFLKDENVIVQHLCPILLLINQQLADKITEEIENKTSDIKSLITGQKKKIRDELLAKISEITNELKSKLDACVDKGEQKINQVIEDAFGGKENVNIKSIEASLINWDYRDYVRVLLMGVGQQDFEKRIRTVVEDEMSFTTKSKYSLKNVVTAVRIKAKEGSFEVMAEGGFYEKVYSK